MKPPPFAYQRPTTLREALEALASDPMALPLSGGQSLVPMLNMRLARPTTVVDLVRTPGLSDIEVTSDGVLIGARVTHHRIVHDPALAKIASLGQAAAQIGFQAIRHRGTVGGSLAHADPAAELPSVLLSLDATVTLSSTNGNRSVPLDEFIVGYYSTSRAPEELVTSISVPTPPDLKTGFAEFSRRPGDFALALAAVSTWTSNGRRLARVAVGGLDVRARRIPAIETLLVDNDPTSAVNGVTRAMLEAETAPSSDIHGSADYRLNLGTEMVKRAIAKLTEAA